MNIEKASNMQFFFCIFLLSFVVCFFFVNFHDLAKTKDHIPITFQGKAKELLRQTIKYFP